MRTLPAKKCGQGQARLFGSLPRPTSALCFASNPAASHHPTATISVQNTLPSFLDACGSLPSSFLDLPWIHILLSPHRSSSGTFLKPSHCAHSKAIPFQAPFLSWSVLEALPPSSLCFFEHAGLLQSMKFCARSSLSLEHYFFCIVMAGFSFSSQFKYQLLRNLAPASLLNLK